MENIDFVISPTKKLYEHVVEALEKVIVLSAADEKLLSEQELADRFNVNKAVVREALTVLKDRGLVQSRNGVGSYVCKPNTETVVNAVSRIIKASSITDQDIHETRLILEISVVRLAAVNVVSEEIARLEKTVEEMSKSTLSNDEWLAIDMEFHTIIAKASRNDLLAMCVEMMMLLLKDYMRKGRYSCSGTVSEHRKIVAALRTGDPDLCESALRCHLYSAWENVSMFEKGRMGPP